VAEGRNREERVGEEYGGEEKRREERYYDQSRAEQNEKFKLNW
jgi:hypothetical protein